MRQISYILVFGLTALCLLQSCAVVRPSHHRHHRHHARHGIAAGQTQGNDTATFDHFGIELAECSKTM